MWRSVRIKCKPGFEDLLSSLIFESGFSGLEEHPEQNRIVYKAYIRLSSEIPDPLAAFRRNLATYPAFHDDKSIEILSVDDIPEEDWETNWRQGLAAIEIGSRLVVRPSWVLYDNTGGRIEVIIDPKMAFGTGGHPTTRLCLEFLENYGPDGKTALDAGCGSGVLSIAAARLGARKVRGFDIDPYSVENAIENVRLNGVEDCVTISEGDIRTVHDETADLVLANIISGVLISSLDRFHRFLEPGGMVVFSGLLAGEKSMFSEALIREGFRVLGIRMLDEWIAVTAEES